MQGHSAATLAVPLAWPNPWGVEFRLIPPGRFYLGAAPSDRDAGRDELPRVLVRIERPFYAATFPLCVGLIRRLLAEEACGGDPALARLLRDQSFAADGREGRLADEAPAVQISAADAGLICAWMSRRDGRLYRLPTEAEWEYLARSGAGGTYWWPPDADPGRCAVFAATGPVGPDPARANAWGLIDTLGNVSEWTGSAYAPLETGAALRSVGPSEATTRVTRGGNWQDRRVEHLRLSRRFSMAVDARKNYLAARLVCEFDDAMSTQLS